MKKKAVIISLILLILFGVWTILMYFGLLSGFDTFIYNFIRSLKSDFFDTYFVFITKFGNESTIILFVVVAVLLLKNKWRMMMLEIPIISVVSNQVIKYIIRRDRPSVLKLIKQGGYSYPSGHSMIAVAVYGLLIYFVLKKVKNKSWKYGLSFLLVVLIVSIGVSRIYVGVHYASDVLGGFILAMAELLLLINFTKQA